MRFFIGIDLSSPRGKSGVCVLEGKNVLFADYVPFSSLIDFLKEWKRKGEVTIAIDGPQGLSGEKGKIRFADSILNTPVKCEYEFPPPSNPYSEFVKGSIQLFYSLHKNRYLLFNSSNLKNFEVLETYPHGIWNCLLKFPLKKKRTEGGRIDRLKVLKKFELETKKFRTHDIIDAGACALTAFLAKAGNFIAIGMDFFEDNGILREGWVILPFLPPFS
jgi:predicted nuclease with RNAse H fold